MLTLDDLDPQRYDTVILAASDIQGRLFGRRIPMKRFLADPAEGVDICTCALAWTTDQSLEVQGAFAGWQTGWQDFRLVPDLSTLRPYPGSPRTVICLADAVDESGKLLEIAPRTVLRRQIERAQERGYEVLLASELEFYLFKGSSRDARRDGFRHLVPTTLIRSDYSIVDQASEEPFISAIRAEMDAADIPVFACQAEYGLGQWEINLDHSAALEMADRHVIYKAGVKEMAMRTDLAITFMPKPVADDMGSSCHFHCSLTRDGTPVFPAPSDGHELSGEGKGFLGGLMTHMSETALLFNPHVNSYKRHARESVGGGIIAWGYDNRTVTFRVVGADKSLHIEHRYAGADANPYMAAAAIIASGLRGVEDNRDPGAPFQGNAYQCPELPQGPATLPEAIATWKRSEFAPSAFGPEVVSHYAAIARAEWSSFMSAVTDWEIRTDFEVV